MKVTKKNFIYTLSRIRNLAHLFLERKMREEGISDISPSYGDVFVIACLYGPMPMKEIARFTYKDKSTITGIVKHLEKNGYLTRVKDGRDGRTSMVSATAKAKKIMKSFRSISKKMNNGLFSGFSDDELTLLFSFLERILHNMKSKSKQGGRNGNV